MTNDRKPNRLVHEKSPYLLQHAHNPVNWFPWSDEAFDKARTEDKPVFLSIGYSTCHWCHVMERESFEDAEVAVYLNEHFVAIKVDKEERPDIDAVYMRVCQALTGSGGWPLTCILTPDKKAFFAGTYFPKQSRYGMNGLLEILQSVIKLWFSDKQKLIRQGNDILAAVRESPSKAYEHITKSALHVAFDTYLKSFDMRYGGFGQAPKFPSPHNLMFLLRYYAFEQQEVALEMALKTLDSMFRGGMFDHVGGGFSRYSTDERWLVPHFEKMLYDNALLTLVYLEAYQITGNDLYRRIAEKTLGYIQREMTDKEGGFYCAQDADSDGEEGKFYVFKPDMINAILGNNDGAYFNRYFGITEKGNFEGANIPNLLDNDTFDQPDARIEALLPAVYDYRVNRTTLFKDQKILTSWNALMLTAYAKAYQVLGQAEYLATAEKAVSFLKEKLTRSDGRLYVRYSDNEAAGTGYLEDYAYTAWAMLTLYEATFDVSHLETAIHYAEKMSLHFEDREHGGLFQYAEDSEALMMRPKETYDGATPSGNSVAAYVFIRLAQLTAEDRWEARAQRQLDFLAVSIKQYPSAYSFGLIATQLELYPSKEVICTAPAKEDMAAIKKALSNVFLPNASVLVKTPENSERINKLVPFAESYLIAGNKATYYICENKACSVPFTDVEELIKRLKDQQDATTPTKD